MPWGAWQTYPEYLDYLASREYALDISSLVAHGAVRNYVMGERGRNNEAATEGDLQQMGEIVQEALEAGAVGFSTSRILGHRSIQGEPVPGTFANDTEIMVIAQALKRADKGVFQIIPASTLGPGRPEAEEHSALEAEVDLICRVSQTSGRPSTFTLFQIDAWTNKWQEVINQVEKGNQDGANVYPQVGSRPTGLVFSLATYHPWMLKPSYRALKAMPLKELKRTMADPAMKRKILGEANNIEGVAMGSMNSASPISSQTIHNSSLSTARVPMSPLERKALRHWLHQTTSLQPNISTTTSLVRQMSHRWRSCFSPIILSTIWTRCEKCK